MTEVEVGLSTARLYIRLDLIELMAVKRDVNQL